jgi:hypothetical protein
VGEATSVATVASIVSVGVGYHDALSKLGAVEDAGASVAIGTSVEFRVSVVVCSGTTVVVGTKEDSVGVGDVGDEGASVLGG